MEPEPLREAAVSLDRLARWGSNADFIDTPHDPEAVFAFEPALNRKVSLWRGAAWQLDVDALAVGNSESLADRSGVTGEVFALGGDDLVFDCAEAELHGFGCAEVQKCRDVAYSNQFGAFTTCAGLLFALMGCLSRIRKRADSNFQKIISCVPDTYGFVCLAITLSAFYVDCYDHLPGEIEGMRMHYFPGPGYVAYVHFTTTIDTTTTTSTDTTTNNAKTATTADSLHRRYFLCWLATGVRVTMHWLVPVPGGGSGCCQFTPPKGGVAARLRALARVDVQAVRAVGDQTVAAAAEIAQEAAQSASEAATAISSRFRGHQARMKSPAIAPDDARVEQLEPAA